MYTGTVKTYTKPKRCDT